MFIYEPLKLLLYTKTERQKVKDSGRWLSFYISYRTMEPFDKSPHLANEAASNEKIVGVRY